MVIILRFSQGLRCQKPSEFCLLFSSGDYHSTQKFQGSILSCFPGTLECMGGFSLTFVSHKTQAAETALFCPLVILHMPNFIELKFHVVVIKLKKLYKIIMWIPKRTGKVPSGFVSCPKEWILPEARVSSVLLFFSEPHWPWASLDFWVDVAEQEYKCCLDKGCEF